MYKYTALPLVLLCCLLLYACAQAQPNTPAQEHIKALSQGRATAMQVQTQTGSVLEIYTATQGSTASLYLEGNPTTGFLWHVLSVEPQGIVRCAQEQFSPLPHAAGMVGVGGIAAFSLQAQQEGRAKLTLSYHRPWVPSEQATSIALMLVVDAHLGIHIKPLPALP
ncbi:MAG: protease inhibitor I42 family protein [Desulfovibrionaceae bacterium]|nr:protease inhibitor I42 family protein [Desulfovibrionaceae bacterium]